MMVVGAIVSALLIGTLSLALFIAFRKKDHDDDD
jgi:hypothetical protein